MKWEELYKTHKVMAWYSDLKGHNVICWADEMNKHYVIHSWEDFKSAKQIECFHRIIANRRVSEELKKYKFKRMSHIETEQLLNSFDWFDKNQSAGIKED